MVAKVEITFSDDSIRAAVSRLIADGNQLDALMDEIGVLAENSARDRIETTNLTPEGVPWPQSLRSYEDGSPTLHDSGLLAASLTHIVGPNTVDIGSNLIYAGVHQKGATIRPVNAKALVFRLPNIGIVQVGSVTIPARPYLGLSDSDNEDIEAATVDFLEARLQ